MAGSIVASRWMAGAAARSVYDEMRLRRPRSLTSQPWSVQTMAPRPRRSIATLHPPSDQSATSQLHHSEKSTVGSPLGHAPTTQPSAPDTAPSSSRPNAYDTRHLSQLSAPSLVSYVFGHPLGPKGRSVSSFDELIDDVSVLDQLRSVLHGKGISETSFTAWYNAIRATSFAEAKAYVDSVSEGTSKRTSAGPWPTFLLLKTLRRVISPAQATEALAVLDTTLPFLTVRAAQRALSILIERIVLDLHVCHEFRRLVAFIIKLHDSPHGTAREVEGTRQVVTKAIRCFMSDGRRHARDAISDLLRLERPAPDAEGGFDSSAIPSHAEWMLSLKLFLLDVAPLPSMDAGDALRLTQPLFLLGPTGSRIREIPVHEKLDFRPPLPSTRGNGLLTLDLVLDIVKAEPLLQHEHGDPRYAFPVCLIVMKAALREAQWPVAFAWHRKAMDMLDDGTQSTDAVDQPDQTAMRKHSLDNLYLELLAKTGHLDKAWMRLGELARDPSAKGKGAQEGETYMPIWHQLLEATAREPSVPAYVWPSWVRGAVIEDDDKPLADSARAIMGVLSCAPEGLWTQPSTYKCIFDGLANRIAYTTTGRRSYVEAAKRTWDAALERDVQPDLRMLHGFCRALLRHADVPGALQTMATWLAPCGSSEPEPRDSHTFSRLQPKAGFLSMALEGFSRSAGALSAWSIYRSMTGAFRVRPDARTLTRLMQCAEVAGTSLVDAGLLRRETAAVEPAMRDMEVQMDWEGTPAPLRVWDLARREILRSFPELNDVQSPLQDGSGTDHAGWLVKGELSIRHVEDWFKQRFKYLTGESEVGQEGQAEEDQDGKVRRHSSGRGLPTNETPPPITFDAEFFHHYISLLRFMRSDDGRQALARFAPVQVPDAGYGSASAGADADPSLRPVVAPTWDEPFRALAWMRKLDIEPEQATLRIVCVDLIEMLPPGAGFFSTAARRARSALNRGPDNGDGEPSEWAQPRSSAAGPLHTWLCEWLGQEGVPTEESVGRSCRRASFVRARRRKQMLRRIENDERRERRGEV